MPSRYDEGDYPYAYQGQEKDTETGMEAFELRLWDARIGRWLTTDPYGQFHSPYLGMGNNPLNGVDADGGCWDSEGNPCPDGNLGDITTGSAGGTWLFSENGWESNSFDQFGADGGTVFNSKPLMNNIMESKLAPAITELSGFNHVIAEMQENNSFLFGKRTDESGMFYVNDQGFFTGITPTAGSGSLGLIGGGGAFKASSGFRNAITIGKGGLSPAGRGLDKHKNIIRIVTAEKIIRTNAEKNTIATKALKFILRNGTKNSKSGKMNGQIVNFIDYKLPSGLGARWYADSGKFFGFLGRGL